MSQSVRVDALSRLLSGARVRAVLDKHCLLAASTVMDVAEQGTREAAFHVLLQGSSLFRVDGVELELRAGDVVIVPDGVAHRVITPGSGSARRIAETSGPVFATTRTRGAGSPVMDLYCGHFEFGSGSGSILFRTLPSPLKVSLAASPEQRALLDALSALLRGEAANEGRGTAAVMSALSTVLLAYVLRNADRPAGEPPVWTSASDAGIARVIDTVLQDPGAEWPIAALADAARMSRATFLRRFVAATGMTPGQFLTRVRMMAAADILQSADLTVSAVAAAVGYASESSFARVFRQEVGRSPGRFRRAPD